MKRTLKIWATGLLMALLFFSCSTTKRASWHLDRAVKLDPSIVKESVDTIVLPELKIDTVVQIDTTFIREDIDSILNSLSDSCREEAKTIIKEPLIKYVKEREIIQDTLYYKDSIVNDSLNLSLIAIIWQDTAGLHLKIFLENAEIKVKKDQLVQPVRKKNFFSSILEIIGVVFIIFILYKLLIK